MVEAQHGALCSLEQHLTAILHQLGKELSHIPYEWFQFGYFAGKLNFWAKSLVSTVENFSCVCGTHALPSSRNAL